MAAAFAAAVGVRTLCLNGDLLDPGPKIVRRALQSVSEGSVYLRDRWAMPKECAPRAPRELVQGVEDGRAFTVIGDGGPLSAGRDDVSDITAESL